MQVYTQIPTRAQNREDIFISTKDTHTHENTQDAQTRVLTSPIRTTKSAHRDVRGEHTDASTGSKIHTCRHGAPVCRRSVETSREKLDAHIGYTRTAGTDTQRGAHGEMQRETRLHSHVDRCRCTNGCT